MTALSIFFGLLFFLYAGMLVGRRREADRWGWWLQRGYRAPERSWWKP